MDYDYDMFYYGVNKIVSEVKDTFDYIIGLNRGGLIPAVVLSHRLNTPMLALNWQTRDSNLRHIPNEIKTLIKDKNILIVDDIIDSGETLELLKDELKDLCNYKIACLIYNTEQKVDCNYNHVTIKRSLYKEWINFWWEKNETT